MQVHFFEQGSLHLPLAASSMGEEFALTFDREPGPGGPGKQAPPAHAPCIHEDENLDLE